LRDKSFLPYSVAHRRLRKALAGGAATGSMPELMQQVFGEKRTYQGVAGALRMRRLSLYAPGSAMPSSRPDPPGFIRANMRIAPVPTLPEIRIYTAHPASGLWRLAELDEDGSGPSPPLSAPAWVGNEGQSPNTHRVMRTSL
jgi:hypothetical protein